MVTCRSQLVDNTPSMVRFPWKDQVATIDTMRMARNKEHSVARKNITTYVDQLIHSYLFELNWSPSVGVDSPAT